MLNWAKKYPALTFAFVLAFIILAAWGPGLVRGDLLMGYDMVSAGLPMSRFESQTLLNGESPFWNPFFFSGGPSMTGIFNPFYWPILLSPTPQMVESIALLVIFLVGIIMYWFAREIGLSPFPSAMAGFIFAFSEHVVARLWAGHLNIVEIQAALPLLFLAIHRLSRKISIPNIALGSASVALLFLPSFPQMAYNILLAGGLFGLFVLWTEGAGPGRLRLIVAGLAMMLGGLALFAVQLLPTLGVLAPSGRGAGVTFDFATEGSFPFWYLITLVSPDFFGVPPGMTLDKLTALGVSINEGPAYLGAVAILLAMFGIKSGFRDRRVRFFTFLALLFLVISMGKYTPLYRLLFDYVPGYGLFRIPSRHLVVVVFCLSLLAAWGIQNLWEQREKAVTAYKMALAMLLGLEALVVLGYVFRNPILDALNTSLPSHLDHYLLAQTGNDKAYLLSFLPELFNNAILSLWLPSLLMVGFCLWYFLFRRNTSADWVNQAILALLLLGGLLAFDLRLTNANMRHYEPVIDNHSTFENIPISGKGRSRALLLEGELTSNLTRYPVAFSVIERIEVVNGYSPVILADYSRYLQLVTGAEEIKNTAQIFTNIARPDLLDLLSVRYVIARDHIPEELSRRWSLLSYEEGIWLYQNPHARPRAYLVSPENVILVPDQNSAFDILQRGIEPDVTVIELASSQIPMTQSVNHFTSVEKSPGSVSITGYQNSYVRLAVNAPSSCFLVLSDIFNPGWTAYVDGEPQTILRANAILRAIPLGPGDHTVEFRFAPAFFLVGATISGATIVLFLFLGALHFWLRRRVIPRQKAG